MLSAISSHIHMNSIIQIQIQILYYIKSHLLERWGYNIVLSIVPTDIPGMCCIETLRDATSYDVNTNRFWIPIHVCLCLCSCPFHE